MKNKMMAYLAALEQEDIDAILELFAPDGVVISPLYGEVEAPKFYEYLFRDTDYTKIVPIDFFTNESGDKSSIHFQYEWKIKGGNPLHFDCVDVFSYNEEGKITELKIIYDTLITRATWEAQRKMS